MGGFYALPTTVCMGWEAAMANKKVTTASPTSFPWYMASERGWGVAITRGPPNMRIQWKTRPHPVSWGVCWGVLRSVASWVTGVDSGHNKQKVEYRIQYWTRLGNRFQIYCDVICLGGHQYEAFSSCVWTPIPPPDILTPHKAKARQGGLSVLHYPQMERYMSLRAAPISTS